MAAVNARLAQVLRYLERDGVTEVVLRVGQPMSMRTASGPTNVTARALTSEQLDAIVRDSELEVLMASRGQDAEIELQAGTLRVVARGTRRDGGIAITLSRAALTPPPRNETPRNEPPRNETPRNETPRNETPRNETPRTKPPTEPPSEFDIDLELDPLVDNESALATEAPVRRSGAIPRPAHIATGVSPVRGPPSLDVGIELDLSLDDMPGPVDHGPPPAPVRSPVQRDSNPAIQRIDPHAGPDRRERQDLRPSSGVFQRVDLRDARAPTPKPVPAESTEDSSAWADIDLAPPTRKR